MAFAVRTTENAAATRTFGALRIERRVLTTPARTIAIANISSVSVGTHVTPKPKVLFWLLALLFAVMAWGSTRPDFSWGPLSPTGFTFVLGIIMLVFAGLALRPDDKTHYLLISSNDGVLSRFTAPDRTFLDEVRSILTDKINRGDGIYFDQTVASGDALVLLECPFRPVDSTLCERCGGYVKLDRIEWSDTRENVAQYRQRVYDSVSFWQRLYYIIAGNAYEGAINLHLDRSGRPKDQSPSLAS